MSHLLTTSTCLVASVPLRPFRGLGSSATSQTKNITVIKTRQKAEANQTEIVLFKTPQLMLFLLLALAFDVRTWRLTIHPCRATGSFTQCTGAWNASVGLTLYTELSRPFQTHPHVIMNSSCFCRVSRPFILSHRPVAARFDGTGISWVPRNMWSTCSTSMAEQNCDRSTRMGTVSL